MNDNYTVIMAGGVGSRFWPMSTTATPKQFLDVLGTGKTLLQLTFDRSVKLCKTENIYIVTNKEYEEIVASQLPELPKENILLEPCRRNTAPCVAYGCYKIHNKNPNAKILIAPSDHLILDESAYLKVINEGYKASVNNILVTLGIKTTRPDTGYGYIESSKEKLEGFSDFSKVAQFTEKPQIDKAKVFHADESYYWNSGMFIWSAKAIINSFEQNCPSLHEIFSKGNNVYNTSSEDEFIAQTYNNCESISVDYAIMENAQNVYVLPCDIGWTDLGTWGSLHGTIENDNNNNAILGKNVIQYDANNNMIANTEEKLMVIQGLQNHIVVNTDKALLICEKDNEQMIKQFVTDLGQNKIYKNLI
ncbi:MAG: mannose-1-phosphate guanylyltransferase [Glaciecola sp.]|jgi:mannose-1-phosphate guanylyltransferase